MNQSRGPNKAPNAQPSAARWIVTANSCNRTDHPDIRIITNSIK
ncbi:MAG: hypothetical protein CM1200mP6_04520 [Anaerolineaceae bacterium]|nr:MAG: hypothetical protein CM1200mP6_04520 [Anaerolineaceae bacterium]